MSIYPSIIKINVKEDTYGYLFAELILTDKHSNKVKVILSEEQMRRVKLSLNESIVN